MINLNQKDILSAYSYFKKSAISYSDKGEIELSLEQIEVCAKLAYHSNYFYTDTELEDLVSRNAKRIFDEGYDDVIPLKGRYAFIDTNGSDNHGLTQQYIRALISAEVEFVYIYEDTDLSRITVILQELKAYPKASIYTFDKEYSLVRKTQMIMSFLKDYKPEKYFMHIMPWDVVAILICNLLTGVTRYNINATDHAYWLGTECIDYNIEFRNYGYCVSLEKRGLKHEQLLLLPYYPILNRSGFNGFPDAVRKTDVKIFSGGSYYKIYGDGGLYFEIVKRLLTDNPNAVILYAGSGNSSKFRQFILENKLEDRIHLLGNRNDIQEVFEACDIYLATYPISGGLMSQYAAVNGKPILAYTSPQLPVNYLESTVCHQLDIGITHIDLEEFYSYAKLLCNDAELRVFKGQELKKGVISPEVFNEEFKYLINNNKSMRSLKSEKIDYDRFSALYLEVENHFQPFFQMLVASKLKFKTLYVFPRIFMSVVKVLINRFLDRHIKN